MLLTLLALCAPDNEEYEGSYFEDGRSCEDIATELGVKRMLYIDI